MQIRTGTAALTNGSNKVIASVGNDWSAATVGSLFGIQGSGVFYDVAAVTGPGVSTSGQWELTLSANWAGPTDPAAVYVINRDFTPHGIPLMAYGDVNAAQIYSRAMSIIDGRFETAAAQGTATAYTAGRTYPIGAVTLGSDGNFYRATSANTNVDPVTTPTGWELHLVLVNVTLNVPAKFTTFYAAWLFLKNAIIGQAAYVTIQFANGTYNMVTGGPTNALYDLNHSFAGRIRILGDTAGTVGNVTLTWASSTYVFGGYYATDNMGAFFVRNGHRMPYLDGLKLVGGGVGKLYYGLQATNGSSIRCGPKMWITDFYAGVAVFFTSTAFIDYMRISNGGDGNIFAYGNCSVSFMGGISEGAGAYYAQSGACIEFTSSLFAPAATFRLNGLAQVAADWNSSLMLDGCTFQSGGAYDYAAAVKCIGGHIGQQRIGGTFTNCSGNIYGLSVGTTFANQRTRIGLSTAYEAFFGSALAVVSDAAKPSLSLSANGLATAFMGFNGTNTLVLGSDAGAGKMELRLGVSNAMTDGTLVASLESGGFRVPARMRVGSGGAAVALNFSNFLDLQVVGLNGAACGLSLTQDGVGTGHFGFAAGSGNFILGADLGNIHFRQSPTATLNAGTLRAVLDLSNGRWQSQGLQIGGGATPGANGTPISQIRFASATIAAGTVTVADTTVTANTKIWAFSQAAAVVGTLRNSARVVGTSYTIASSASDSGAIVVLLIEP